MYFLSHTFKEFWIFELSNFMKQMTDTTYKISGLYWLNILLP